MISYYAPTILTKTAFEVRALWVSVAWE